MKKKKARLKSYLLYDSMDKTFWIRQNSWNRKQISGFQGLQVKEGAVWAEFGGG